LSSRLEVVYNGRLAAGSGGTFVKGLRFERIGQGRYYNVVFPAERFLDLLIDRVGYSSYLKDQIRKELKSSGDPVTQITVLQGAIREL
jgi:hypothetical protein